MTSMNLGGIWNGFPCTWSVFPEFDKSPEDDKKRGYFGLGICMEGNWSAVADSICQIFMARHVSVD